MENFKKWVKQIKYIKPGLPISNKNLGETLCGRSSFPPLPLNFCKKIRCTRAPASALDSYILRVFLGQGRKGRSSDFCFNSVTKLAWILNYAKFFSYKNNMYLFKNEAGVKEKKKQKKTDPSWFHFWKAITSSILRSWNIFFLFKIVDT